MKKPKPRVRGYDQGGPVDPNSMSRSISQGMQTAMSMAGTMNAMNRGASHVDTTSTFRKGGPITRTVGPRVGKDDGMIAAQKGEYVVRKSAVKKLGGKALATINRGKLPKAAGRERDR